MFMSCITHLTTATKKKKKLVLMELFKTNCLLRGEKAQKETEDPDCYKFSGTFSKKNKSEHSVFQRLGYGE